MAGRDGTDTSYWTHSIPVYVGSSYDAIFTAPPHQGPGAYDTYLLYNRDTRATNRHDGSGHGGQMTEVCAFMTDLKSSMSL